jgi:hypothetical protein
MKVFDYCIEKSEQAYKQSFYGCTSDATAKVAAAAAAAKAAEAEQEKALKIKREKAAALARQAAEKLLQRPSLSPLAEDTRGVCMWGALIGASTGRSPATENIDGGDMCHAVKGGGDGGLREWGGGQHDRGGSVSAGQLAAAALANAGQHVTSIHLGQPGGGAERSGGGHFAAANAFAASNAAHAAAYAANVPRPHPYMPADRKFDGRELSRVKGEARLEPALKKDVLRAGQGGLLAAVVSALHRRQQQQAGRRGSRQVGSGGAFGGGSSGGRDGRTLPGSQYTVARPFSAVAKERFGHLTYQHASMNAKEAQRQGGGHALGGGGGLNSVMVTSGGYASSASTNNNTGVGNQGGTHQGTHTYIHTHAHTQAAHLAIAPQPVSAGVRDDSTSAQGGVKGAAGGGGARGCNAIVSVPINLPAPSGT